MSLFKIYTYRTFEPTEISGLQVWLDNDTLGADGSAVSTWSDSSGNGYNFVQSNASYQPTVFVDGTEKTLRLLENSFLTCLSGLSMLKNVAGATLYVVSKQLTTGQSPTLTVSTGVQSIDARASAFVSVNKYVSQMTALDNGTLRQALSSQSVNTTNYKIQAAYADFANQDLNQYIDSALDGSSVNAGGSNTSNTDSIGIFLGAYILTPSTNYFPSGTTYPRNIALARVNIKEVLIFNRILTALEKYNVEHYLSIKHGITLT